MAYGDYPDGWVAGVYADAFEHLGEQVQIRTSTGWNDGLTGTLVGIQQAPTLCIRDEHGVKHHIGANILTGVAPAPTSRAASGPPT